MSQRFPVGVTGPKEHDPRATLDDPLEFGHGAFRISDRHLRSGEDAPLVCEAPILVQPAVERVEVRIQRVHVVTEMMLYQDPRRGEHDRRLDALFVHLDETRRA
jgi:hypothetical protein